MKYTVEITWYLKDFLRAMSCHRFPIIAILDACISLMLNILMIIQEWFIKLQLSYAHFQETMPTILHRIKATRYPHYRNQALKASPWTLSPNAGRWKTRYNKRQQSIYPEQACHRTLGLAFYHVKPIILLPNSRQSIQPAVNAICVNSASFSSIARVSEYSAWGQLNLPQLPDQ